MKLNREEQNFILKHWNKIGWLFSSTGIIIFVIGLIMLIISLFDGSNTTELKQLIEKINSQNVSEIDSIMRLSISIRNDFFDSFTNMINIIFSGLIIFLGIRFIVAIGLIIRTFDDYKHVINYFIWVISRLFIHLLQIVIYVLLAYFLIMLLNDVWLANVKETKSTLYKIITIINENGSTPQTFTLIEEVLHQSKILDVANNISVNKIYSIFGNKLIPIYITTGAWIVINSISLISKYFIIKSYIKEGVDNGFYRRM